MNKTAKFLTFSSLTCTSLFLPSAATAFGLFLANQLGNDYKYTVTLDADDSLTIGDQLIFSNLSGVTVASANSPYLISSGDFDETSANFIVDTPTNGVSTLTEVISLSSVDSLDNLEYMAFYTDNGTPRVASGSLASVPFDFSPNLAMILVLCAWGLHQLKGKFS